MPGSVSAFAPGRVTLFACAGESLSFAIDRGATVRATALPGPFVIARAQQLGETDTFDLQHPRPAAGWRGLVRGSAAHLAWAGNRLRPARLAISGTVPRGTGLASSTSITLATALALLAHAGAGPQDPAQLARLCALVEGDWGKTNAVASDALVPLVAPAGQVLHVHMESLSATAHPLDLDGWSFAMVPARGRRDDTPRPAPGTSGSIDAALDAIRDRDPERLAALLGPGGRSLGGGATLTLLAPGERAPGALRVAPSGPARILE